MMDGFIHFLFEFHLLVLTISDNRKQCIDIHGSLSTFNNIDFTINNNH